MYALQVSGWGGRCGVYLCAGSVSAESVQRAQYLQQSDDPMLQALARGEVSLYAGPAPLRLTLLLSHAGWWSVYTLGLERLMQLKGVQIQAPCVYMCCHVGVKTCGKGVMGYVVCSKRTLVLWCKQVGDLLVKPRRFCEGGLCWFSVIMVMYTSNLSTYKIVSFQFAAFDGHEPNEHSGYYIYMSAWLFQSVWNI